MMEFLKLAPDSDTVKQERCMLCEETGRAVYCIAAKMGNNMYASRVCLCPRCMDKILILREMLDARDEKEKGVF